jgi:hypothetical protein
MAYLVMNTASRRDCARTAQLCTASIYICDQSIAMHTILRALSFGPQTVEECQSQPKEPFGRCAELQTRCPIKTPYHQKIRSTVTQTKLINETRTDKHSRDTGCESDGISRRCLVRSHVRVLWNHSRLIVHIQIFGQIYPPFLISISGSFTCLTHLRGQLKTGLRLGGSQMIKTTHRRNDMSTALRAHACTTLMDQTQKETGFQTADIGASAVCLCNTSVLVAATSTGL